VFEFFPVIVVRCGDAVGLLSGALLLILKFLLAVVGSTILWKQLKNII
jgi:hypothetical protein